MSQKQLENIPPLRLADQPLYVVTGNLMNRESAHFSPSKRVKGDFEQMVINGLKENSQIQKVKTNTEAEDERLCSCIIKHVRWKIKTKMKIFPVALMQWDVTEKCTCHVGFWCF